MPTREDHDARRRYWTETMDEMDTLVDRMLACPYEECGEPLAPIPEAMTAADVEVLFSDTLIGGSFPRVFAIRESLLRSLIEAAREMSDQGWVLKIEDGFRSMEMQTHLGKSPEAFDLIVGACIWECGGDAPPIDLVFRRARVLVANYGKCGTHMQGTAVDISVIRRGDGSEVWRGRPYLDMSEYTPMDSPFVTPEERDNRRAITELMARHGFVHFPGEFWHYSKGDILCELLAGGNRPGIYGPVHWDQSTGQVTPYDDPNRPLIPPAQMETELADALKRAST